MKRGLSHQPDVGKKTLDRHLISPYVNTMSGLDINSWFVAQGVFLMSETFCSESRGSWSWSWFQHSFFFCLLFPKSQENTITMTRKLLFSVDSSPACSEMIEWSLRTVVQKGDQILLVHLSTTVKEKYGLEPNSSKEYQEAEEAVWSPHTPFVEL